LFKRSSKSIIHQASSDVQKKSGYRSNIPLQLVEIHLLELINKRLKGFKRSKGFEFGNIAVFFTNNIWFFESRVDAEQSYNELFRKEKEKKKKKKKKKVIQWKGLNERRRRKKKKKEKYFACQA